MMHPLSDIRRYAEMAGLIVQFGLLEAKMHRSADVPFSGRGHVAPADAERLTQRLEGMGPCYIKLGQFLTTRSDLLPEELLNSLSRLQDHVQPFSYDQAKKIIETELGVRVSKAFFEFETAPLASASLSQVHRATLPSGKRVVVKIQRPGIQKQISDDLKAMLRVAAAVEKLSQTSRRLRIKNMLEEFRKAMLRELDFRIEASQIVTLKNNLRHFRDIVLPEPVADYTSAKVLTMTYIPGKKISEITPLGRTELDGAHLADEIYNAYLHQVLINGFFHADPHPGNVLITEDFKIGLVDLGMVSILSQDVRNKLLKLLVAMNEGNGYQAGRHFLDFSLKAHDFNEEEYFRRMNLLMTQYQGVSGEPVEVGRMVMEIIHISTQCGVIYPMELTMLAKTLMHLDQAGKLFDPDFSPRETVRKHIGRLLRRKMRDEASVKGAIDTLMEIRELLAFMPERLNIFMERLADNKLSFNVEMLDEVYLMTGFQKVANRLTTGVLLAALIVGAALMMKVKTEFTLLGYPGLAIIFFLIAGLGAMLLILGILFQDEPSRRK